MFHPTSTPKTDFKCSTVLVICFICMVNHYNKNFCFSLFFWNEWRHCIENNRYLSEAHVQAMQFDEAENLCKRTLEIHRVHSPPASLEEAADRRLMALICEAKGDYESALEHLVLASMAMIANGQDNEVAAIDVSIGNIYLSLSRFDEAVFSYQKALTVFKSSKGDNHPSVASVFVRLADLYHKTGTLALELIKKIRICKGIAPKKRAKNLRTNFSNNR